MPHEPDPEGEPTLDDVRREALSALLRRVDEVRGMSDRGATGTVLDPGDHDALVQTLRDLVEELERSHRRLIETNVQLVSLREVASSLASATDVGETTRTVTRYLARAFGFDDVFLLLVHRERAELEGTWTHRSGGRETSWNVALPALGDTGAAVRALWLDRTVVQYAVDRHPIVTLPDGHPLLDALPGLGPTVCVPLPRSHTPSSGAEQYELCGARCLLGDAAFLVPPPGPAAERWALEREERQQHCLKCELLPSLGVVGVARRGGAGPHERGDPELLESIALSLAPMLENARLAQDLRRSERFRESVLDSMASALVAVNLRGEVLTFNRSAEELLGWREAEVLNRPFGELFGHAGEQILAGTLEHGRTVRREETVLATRDGRALPVSLTTSLLRHDRRSVLGAIATFVDLTPFRRAEEHARQLDRLAALGRFTSSVAHEIRNPLTGIASGVDYVTRSLALDQPQREHLDFIQREVRRLDRVLQDLFDITHPRELRFLVAPVETTVKRSIQCVEALMAERGVTAELEIEPRTPPVRHDADQLQQVLINLLKNAAEASPAGVGVRVHVGLSTRGTAPAGTAEAPVPAAVAIRIEDRGGGIAPEHLKTVFEPFFTTKQGGSGLGLYISHDIVKRHGGHIAIHSEPGRGATFVVELPLEPSGGTQ